MFGLFTKKPQVKKEYYPNGTVQREEYFVEVQFQLADLEHRVIDIQHRTDGPAYVEYHSDGTVIREEYILQGRLHRTNGPAEIIYYPDGTVKREAYYLQGRKLDYFRHAVQTDELV